MTLAWFGIWSQRGAGRLFSISMAVAVAGIILNILSVARDSDTLHIGSLLTLFVFLLLATINAMRQVAVGNEISFNRIVGAICIYLLLGVMWRIVGAICIYLLLGVMWSITYAVVEFSQPGSFKGMTETVSPAWNRDWVYFSFVTITTLGYGDITPLSQTARSLAFAEAIVGQFAYISAKQGGSKND
jgi:hypothetical protein